MNERQIDAILLKKTIVRMIDRGTADIRRLNKLKDEYKRMFKENYIKFPPRPTTSQLIQMAKDGTENEWFVPMYYDEIVLKGNGYDRTVLPIKRCLVNRYEADIMVIISKVYKAELPIITVPSYCFTYDHINRFFRMDAEQEMLVATCEKIYRRSGRLGIIASMMRCPLATTLYAWLRISGMKFGTRSLYKFLRLND